VIVSSNRPAEVERIANARGVPARAIGKVVAAEAPFTIRVGAQEFIADTRRLSAAFHEAIPRLMTRVATAAETPEGAAAPAST